MDNSKKIAPLLRSIADVCEQNIDEKHKIALVRSALVMIGGEEEDQHKKAIKTTLDLIHKMDKIGRGGTKKNPIYKEFYSEIDKIRSEWIDKHHKEYKMELDEETLLKLIPNAKDFKTSNGDSLVDVLKKSKLIMETE